MNNIRLVTQPLTDSTVRSFSVVTDTADPAYREIGFDEAQDAVTGKDSADRDILFMTPLKNLPGILGRIFTDTTLSINFNQSVYGSSPKNFTLSQEETAGNRYITDIVKDINTSFADAVSAAGSRRLPPGTTLS